MFTIQQNTVKRSTKETMDTSDQEGL